MALVKGIHHVCLKTNSEEKYQETIKFYTEVLDGIMLRHWDGACHIDLGGQVLEIFNSANDLPETGSIRHYSIGTDNVDGCVEVVRKAGYKVTVEPRDVVLPSETPLPARIAFVVGPCNEEIEFFDEKQ